MKQAKQVIPVRQTFAVRGILFLGVLLLVFLVMHPREGFASAKEGMTLWLNTLLPTLLPFMILTGILIHTGGIEKLLTPLAPVFRFLLGVDVYGGYVFLLGMLCGYPMGAKLASDLYEAGKISRSEAHYLTTFCNHASPAFVITYLGQHCLKGTVPVSRLFISLLSADFICMLFFRFRIYPKTKTSISTGREHNKPPHIRRVNICEENIRKKDIRKENIHKENIHKENIRGLNIREEKETSAAAVSVGGILDVSIMNGFETITRLGGYILLFLCSGRMCPLLLAIPAFLSVSSAWIYGNYNRAQPDRRFRPSGQILCCFICHCSGIRGLLYSGTDKKRPESGTQSAALPGFQMYQRRTRRDDILSSLRDRLVNHRRHHLLVAASS